MPKPRRTKVSAVTESILKSIASGRTTGVGRLPSEEKLAARYGVSLGTVQKALAGLAHQGVIDRHQGRGTFVAKRQQTAVELRYLKFQDRAGQELPLYVRSHKLRSMTKAGPWSKFLGDSENFLHIRRVIEVGGKFDVLSEFVLRRDEFRGLNGVEWFAVRNNSLREMFRQQFALPTTRVEQHITFEPLPARAAKLLKMQPRAKGVVMELLGYTIGDRPFCYQRISSGIFDAVLVVAR